MSNLTQEDIFSLGFREKPKVWVGYNYYELPEISPLYPYYLRVALFHPIRQYRESSNIEHQFCKIYVQRWSGIQDPDNHDESKKVFEGFILDKEQLISTLRQLGIL